MNNLIGHSFIYKANAYRDFFSIKLLLVSRLTSKKFLSNVQSLNVFRIDVGAHSGTEVLILSLKGINRNYYLSPLDPYLMFKTQPNQIDITINASKIFSFGAVCDKLALIIHICIEFNNIFTCFVLSRWLC